MDELVYRNINLEDQVKQLNGQLESYQSKAQDFAKFKELNLSETLDKSIQTQTNPEEEFKHIPIDVKLIPRESTHLKV